MAKIHNYHVLCPLIDQKSFLGVEKDKEKEFVIVTLGRNVVNKYRLSDQKQIGGWTSKDHITTAVVYDRIQDDYVGVFNNNTIKTWKEDSENLDKLKKIKFPVNILKLVPRKKQVTHVIFTNGMCATLPYALEQGKKLGNKAVFDEDENIIDAIVFTLDNIDHVLYMIKNKNNQYDIVICPLREELGDMDKSKMIRVKVSRPKVFVVGKLLTKYSIFILWSDSKMTVYDLKTKTWRTIGTVPWVSTQSSVSLSWMETGHILIFGTNTDQDGAIIVAYNINLGVGACRYPMKIYTEGAKLYCFNGRIILESSNHIGMLPYTLETQRNLSSLLGSHEIMPNESSIIANWDTPIHPNFQVTASMTDVLKLGITERIACAQAISPLLEKPDYKKVFKVTKEFTDVPESTLVQLLSYVLKSLRADSVNVINVAEFTQFCSDSTNTDRFEMLNYLLNLTFSDAVIMPHLRNGLSLDETLFLMTYISYLLIEPERTINIDYENKLHDWCSLFMDAFYQQFVMMKNEKVTIVLQNLLDVVNILVQNLQNINATMPLLNKILSGKGESIDNTESLSYSIELMEI